MSDFTFIHLQGSRCESDVNECTTFDGTDLGCQNGGTCVNTNGSFRYIALIIR